MRTQTAREKAEAHVALIRREYPNPQVPGGREQKVWYCVIHAAGRYDRAHEGKFHLAGNANAVCAHNNAGRFEESWLALTDCYEEKFEAATT